jgi:hypothetical protein
MAYSDDVKVQITNHGAYQTSVESFERMIVRYLPDSVAGLREKIAERGLYPPHHYDDLHTVTECLMILAEFDGLATS